MDMRGWSVGHSGRSISQRSRVCADAGGGEARGGATAAAAAAAAADDAGAIATAPTPFGKSQPRWARRAAPQARPGRCGLQRMM